MKQKIYAMLAAAALIFGVTSCDKNDNDVPTEGNQVLVVKLPDNVKMRSTEDQVATGTTATAISNTEVFLINSGSGAVVDHKTFVESSPGSKYMRFEEVSASVNKVVVVANIPSAVFGTVQGLLTENAIKTYAFTTASQNAGLGGIDDKTLMGEGVPVTATDPNPDGHDYKAVTVPLNALTARFEIGTVKAGEGIQSIELLGVWINNFYGDGSKPAPTLYTNSDTRWQTNPLANTSPSATPFNAVTIPPYNPFVEYHNAGVPDVSLTSGSKVYAYHVFAGSSIPHVIMLVRGEYKDGYYDAVDGTKYFLGWVTFVNYKDDATSLNITSILANKIYKMGVGEKGVIIDAENITPEPELGKFDLGVTVTITPWTEINVTPSVN